MLKNKRYILILLGFCLSINLCVGFRLFATETEKNGEALGYEKMQVFTKVIRLIRENYVNEKDTTYEHLLYDAMRGMLSSLDRFSAFMTPDEYRNMQEDTQGEFGGLGIYLT
ncbi:MAG: peptidase S41, partial [Verrucomicrobiota bacterium]|nr:peptidase S41 [Verrucomicrobiota bacterium]